MTTTITTRVGKGGRLSFTEMDANFTNLKATADAAAVQATTYLKSEVDSALATKQATLGFTPVNANTVGAASGLATLDSAGKLTTAQIPASVVGAMQYQGTWDPSINTPALVSGAGIKGQFYKVSAVANTVTTVKANTTVNNGFGTNVTSVQLLFTPVSVAVGDILTINGQTATITAINSPQQGYQTFTPALSFGNQAVAILAKQSTLDGITQFNVGDIVAFNGTIWDKIDGISSEVVSVAGRTGVVVLTTTDVAENSNLYFTTARASAAAPVQTVFGRTGSVVLTTGDISTALGFTPATLATASTTVLGGVKVGANLAIDANGVLSAIQTATTFASQLFVATAAQTVFTIAGGYTVGLIDVFSNGYKLTANDYTATNGTSIVLTAGTAANDEVEVKVYSALNVTSNLVAVANGGTGATTAIAALANLGALPTAGGTVTGALNIQTIFEKISSVAAAPTAVTNIDVLTAGIWNYTVAATANFALNIRGNSTATLNTTLAIGQSVTCAVLVLNGATAYYPTSYTIDGVAVTPKWNGTAPTAGDASAIDSYSLTILKSAASTYTVLASVTKFA
jgi:hypothetical protein